MKEWFAEKHVWMKLLSLLLSLFLWFYVIYQDNPERTVTFSDIPVRLLNADYIKRTSGLVIINEEQPTVTIKLSGSFARLESLTESDIRVTADLSKLTNPGTYFLSYDISALDGITVVHRSDDIQVNVGELATVELPVSVAISGDLPENVAADTAVADPITVSVTGLKETVETAECVQVLVNGSDLTSPCSADFSFAVLDHNGNAIEDDSLEYSTKTVHVDIPIYRVKALPIRVEMIYGLGATEENTLVTLSESFVTVMGDIDTVDTLEEVLVGTIDTTSFTQEINECFDIVLPEGVSLVGGDASVSVYVTFQNLETRQIVVNDIQVANIPARYQVEVDTTQVLVSVRGTPEMLDSLASGDVAVVADLTDVKLVSGMQNVSAVVMVSERVADLGVFGSYSIVIKSKLKVQTPINVEPVEDPTETGE